MTTIRVDRRTRYTTIDRATLNDSSLSFRARGVLAWLLDKPDDWRCSANEIAQAGKEGRDAVRAALKELEAAKYLIRVRQQDDGGRWSTESVIRERPLTEDGKPGVGFPAVGFPGAIEKTETETPLPPTDESGEETTEERILRRLSHHEVWYRPQGDKAVKYRRAMIDTLLKRGATESEILRRAVMLRDRWPNCDNPERMLIAKWDDWAPLTAGERYQ